MRLRPQGLAVLLEVAHGVFIKELGQLAGCHRLAVDRQPLVQVGHLVARHADDALDVVLTGPRRIAEHHDIAALGLVAFGQLGIEHRQADAVVVFVDQDQVTHQQGRDHGARGDLERLEQEGTQQEDHHDHREQAGRPVQPPGLHQQAFTGLGQFAPFVHGNALLLQACAPLQRLGFQPGRRRLALWQEIEALGQPVQARNH